MTESNSTVEKNSELVDERHAIESITNRIEGLISMGKPTCDACYSLDSQDRPEEGEFWPSPLTIFVNIEGETLVEWMHKTVCDHHNPLSVKALLSRRPTGFARDRSTSETNTTTTGHTATTSFRSRRLIGNG